jgi:(2Fe-2S) ferredoxin
MFKTRTHFEQVPLEVVRKIIEEQLRREKTVEQSQVTYPDVLNNLADAVPELLILRR